MYKVEGLHVYYHSEVMSEGSHLVALATSENYARAIAELMQKAEDEAKTPAVAYKPPPFGVVVTPVSKSE